MVTPQTKQVSRQIFDVLTTDRAVNVINADIPSTGTLLSVSVTVTSGSPRRQTYSVAELQKVDGTVLKGLYAGYVDQGDNSVSGNGAWNIDTSMRIQMRSYSSTAATLTLVYTILEGVSSTALNWTGKFEGSTEGQGAWKIVVGSVVPAVATGDSGGVMIQTVPTGARWKFKALRFQYATSGTAAARNVNLRISDGSNILHQLPCGRQQNASEVVQYDFSPQLDFKNSLVTGAADLTTPMPEYDLIAGYEFRSAIGAKKMGDRITIVNFAVEEWLEP